MLHSVWAYLVSLWHTMYVPKTGPLYGGAVWSNVFVMPVCAAVGFAWAKSKFWPLLPLKHGIASLHDRHDDHKDALASLAARVEELHDKHDALHSKVDSL